MNGRLTFLLVIVSLAISYSTWTYSFRMVKPPVKSVQKPTTIGVKYTDSSKKPHRSTLLTTDLSTKSLRAIIAKVPSASISTKLPRRKHYVQSKLGGVVALPLPLAGFRSMVFTVKHFDAEIEVGNGSNYEMLGSLEWCSVGSKCGFRIHCDLSIEGGGEVAVTTRVASGGMRSQDVDDITELIDSALKKELERSVHLVAARERQKQASKKNADAAAVTAKKKQLDQIIHPEKYRGRSPTVRRPGSAGGGSAGGSGRYTPSASTQARRQVNKG